MNKDTALRLALEALESADWYINQLEMIVYSIDADGINPERKKVQDAMDILKDALEAKDEPEYYGLTKDHLWMSISKEHYDRLKPEFRMACYTIPPQRKPLTDEEITKIFSTTKGLDFYLNFARAIEAAHQIYEVKK
jgi:hypothetical protein